MPKNPTPELLTSAQVCQLLAVDRSTLSRWVKEGRITPALKMPGLRGGYLFNRDSIPVPKRAS